MQFHRRINSFLLRLMRAILLKKGYFGIDQFANYSFSQMGEDRILAAIFSKKKEGFYVDIGAYHPKLYSNTYYFYLRGWKGINIDAMEGSMQLFEKLRPRDINIEISIGEKKETRTYFMFTNSAMNSFSKVVAKKVNAASEHKIVSTKKTNVYPLSFVLDKYLPEKQRIDFMNIDVEGLDYEVLISSNWKKYRPRVILVEDIDFVLGNPKSSNIYKFLYNKGYRLYAMTNVTLVFEDKNNKK